MAQLIEAEGRAAIGADVRGAAQRLLVQAAAPADDAPPVTDDTVRSEASTSVSVPEPPFWGVRELEVPMDEIYRHLDTHVLFKLHWGGRGVKGEAWEALVRDDFKPRLERMWRGETYL